MITNAEHFDRWIRSDFAGLNTELEELYFAREDRATTGAPALLRDRGSIC